MRALLLWSGPVLEAAVLAGLIVRRRLHYAYLLPVYLLAVLIADIGVGVSAAGFTWRVWLLKEMLHAALLLALGVEVGLRTMRRLPGPAAALAFVALIMAVSTGVVLREAPREHILFEVIPRIRIGTAGLYIGTLFIPMLFRVPIEKLHAAILLGLSPYMLLYAATWGRVRSAEGMALADIANPLFFVLALLVLLQAAWQRDDNPAQVPAHLLRFLWPWRS